MRKIKALAAMVMAIALTLSLAGCAAQTGTQTETQKVITLWEEGKERNKIVVISDLHLGIKDEYTETLAHRPLLVEFLQRLQGMKDVRELVIAGDFLDAWYLPVYYPSYTDETKFYKDVIANNQEVINELNNITNSGIKLVYVIGNHDLTLEADVLQEAIPKIEQVSDTKGLGLYYTGDRQEIVIEHGHRYDVFSAPDTLTNKELCGNDETILPAGYIYARYAATWVLEKYPKVEKDLPVVKNEPEKTDTDQNDAYAYYNVLNNISNKITPNEGLDEEIFDLHIAGFDDTYTYLDFFPCEQEDGTISAPVLFRNIQRTWDERQELNNVRVPVNFKEAVYGALDPQFFAKQAVKQHIENPDKNIEIVVFGHTHAPEVKDLGNGQYYANSGTWVDPKPSEAKDLCTFVVITTGAQDEVELYKYEKSGAVVDLCCDPTEK